MTKTSLQADYFDALYEINGDPWNFKSSPYEAEKYAATLAALPRLQYGSGIEVGCSIGVLTRMLAARCSQMLGVDVSKTAILAAEEYCADVNNVTFKTSRFPSDIPDEKSDLIVLSEVLYYFDNDELALAAHAVREISMPDADVVCVHWLGPTPDYPMTGDEAVEAFINAIGPMKVISQARSRDYRLDLLRLV